MEIAAKRTTMKWVELVFNLTYLLTIFISGALLYRPMESGGIRWKFAIMSLLLGAGDSFHLIPRVLSLLDNQGKDYSFALGIGKLITSISMTIFYIILWEIGKEYYGFDISNYISLLVYGLAFLRVILCLPRQNQWVHKNPSYRWGIIRNIPFLILGTIVMVLFLAGSLLQGGPLSYLWLAILVSFACYMPVVLYVQEKPIIGMLMLPKSCAYVAIVLMGFHII